MSEIEGAVRSEKGVRVRGCREKESNQLVLYLSFDIKFFATEQYKFRYFYVPLNFQTTFGRKIEKQAVRKDTMNL